MRRTLNLVGGGRYFPSSYQKGGKALTLVSERLPKGGQRCKGGDSRG